MRQNKIRKKRRTKALKLGLRPHRAKVQKNVGDQLSGGVSHIFVKLSKYLANAEHCVSQEIFVRAAGPRGGFKFAGWYVGKARLPEAGRKAFRYHVLGKRYVVVH